MLNPVKRRLVLYCPGYDAIADRRYYRLMVTQFALLTAQFGIEREIGPVDADERVPSVRWSVAAGSAEWRTETSYEVLRWDDLIRRDLEIDVTQNFTVRFVAKAHALKRNRAVCLFDRDGVRGIDDVVARVENFETTPRPRCCAFHCPRCVGERFERLIKHD